MSGLMRTDFQMGAYLDEYEDITETVDITTGVVESM